MEIFSQFRFLACAQTEIFLLYVEEYFVWKRPSISGCPVSGSPVGLQGLQSLLGSRGRRIPSGLGFSEAKSE
jgi:hypothetical protein